MKIQGTTVAELEASIKKAFRKTVFRHLGKPVEKCSASELEVAFPGGVDFDVGSGEPGLDWELGLVIAKCAEELGLAVCDRTVEVTEPFEPEPGYPEVRFEKTRLNIYTLVDGERVAYRGSPDKPEEAGTWVSMVPGCIVRDTDYEQIEIFFRQPTDS